MKTKQQREAEFRAAIQAVLREHGAEISVVEDDSRPWSTQGVLFVSMDSVYDGDEMMAEFCEFEW